MWCCCVVCLDVRVCHFGAITTQIIRTRKKKKKFLSALAPPGEGETVARCMLSKSPGTPGTGTRYLGWEKGHFRSRYTPQYKVLTASIHRSTHAHTSCIPWYSHGISHHGYIITCVQRGISMRYPIENSLVYSTPISCALDIYETWVTFLSLQNDLSRYLKVMAYYPRNHPHFQWQLSWNYCVAVIECSFSRRAGSSSVSCLQYNSII